MRLVVKFFEEYEGEVFEDEVKFIEEAGGAAVTLTKKIEPPGKAID